MDDASKDGSGPPLATVGILGGMSSESTVEYYRQIDAGVGDALGGHHDAELLIASVNFGRIERSIREDRWDAAADLLADRAGGLQRAGAEALFLATNTMHRVAPAIEDAVEIPLVHVVDVVAEAARDHGVDTVGLLGTETTMTADFYRDRLGDHGVETLIPDPDAVERVDEIIFEELVDGVVRSASQTLYRSVIDDLVARGAGAVVFGCTEIELLIEPDTVEAVPVLDSTALHVDRAVSVALEPASPTD